MAESNFAEKLNVDDTPVTDVMTGDQNKRMYLYCQLVKSIRQAKQIDIILLFPGLCQSLRTSVYVGEPIFSFGSSIALGRRDMHLGRC